MYEFLNTFKQGVNLWKKAGFQQSMGIIILLISVSPIIVIIGSLLLISVSNTNVGQSNLKSVFVLIVSNPLVLLLIFILLCIGLLFVLILVGTVQKIAHNHASGNFSRFKEIFNLVISKILNLSLVGISTLLIAVIPLQLLVMVLVPIKAAAPSIIGSSGGIDLDLVWDLFEAIVFSFIFALVGGAGFLSISAIVIDEADLTAFMTGWRLFLKTPVPTLGSMIIIWLGYLSVFLFGRFMLLEILSILISDELVLFFAFVLSTLILLSLTLFILSPLFFTVMYSVYWNKYRMIC
ncbi:MAG: hypothetical protein ACW964_05265 [Candidatus Hodarchaeales archaeon]|jgi:hypothetical protein